MTIQKLILSLLLLCQLLLGQSALADSLKPIDFIKDPSLLANQWQDEPIPLSSYTAEEKRLQRLINEKTATAVQTYSTTEQDKEWQQIDKDPITPTTWKILELDLTESNGKTYHTSLLRPNWWIRNIGADRNGNRFYLKIPEVVEGWAVVKDIHINQLDTRLWNEARQGDFVYRPLTATFQHDSDSVQQLYFTGNNTPLEVTPEHPIYSIDRNDFVHAGSLRIGEQVKTRQGITTLEQRKQLSGTHRVYNLEVYRDHNFMVSLDSILVHNSQGKGSSPGSITFMKSDDNFVKNAAKRQDKDSSGFLDVVAHGSSQRIEVQLNGKSLIVDHRTAANLIKNNNGYNNQPIRLLSCSTGSCNTGFAQNLANKLGVTVKAPTDILWAFSNGKMVVAPRRSSNPKSPLFNQPDMKKIGGFKEFYPGNK